MDEFTKEELYCELLHGRELEFSLGEKKYFIGPKSRNTFYIWDAQLQQTLCVGSIDRIFAFSFGDGLSLQNNFESFHIDYLL